MTNDKEPGDAAESERGPFEAWADAAGFNIHRDESEKYTDYHRATTRWAWEAWQARASLAATPQPAIPPGFKVVPPEWIVNDVGELGVMIEGRAFFLYKGDSLEYEDGKHEDGTPILYRMVGKREFGEVCYPAAFYRPDFRIPERYTVDLVYTPGLSFGKPEDGAWKPLPHPMSDTRTCTCHPDDNPPTPCPRKFALSECLSAAPVPEAGQGVSDEQLARMFHDTYEQLAPAFGYETRPDTRQFDPDTANGRLMAAVCANMRALLSPAPAQAQAPVEVSDNKGAQK